MRRKPKPTANNDTRPNFGLKKTVDVREAILGVASNLFVRQGFGGTNMHDISAALGISRPALYYYFKSKEEILASLVNSFTLVAKKEATSIATKAVLDTAGALKGLATKYALLVLGHAVEFRVLDRTETLLTGRTRRVHDHAKRELLEQFTATIEGGIAKGHFRPVDPRIAALSIIAMCNWTAWWYRVEGRKSKDALADSIADLAVHAVARPGARRPERNEPREALRVLREDLSYLERLINAQ